MVIVCDKCGTRFHLADGRIGPSGAKVRCSNCHHRFHVGGGGGDAEDPAPPSPQERAIQDSADAVAQAGVEAEAAARAEQTRDAATALEPDLENPEFIFDDEPAEGASMSDGLTLDARVPGAGGGETFANALTRPADPALAAEAAEPVAQAAPADEPEPEPEPVPVPPAEDDSEPSLSLGEDLDDSQAPGEPTPVFGVDPGVSARQEQLRAEEQGEQRSGEFEIERNVDFSADDRPDTMDAASFGDVLEPTPNPVSEAVAAAEVGDAGAADAASDLGALDDDDELADWDPLGDTDAALDPEVAPPPRPGPPSPRAQDGPDRVRTEHVTGLAKAQGKRIDTLPSGPSFEPEPASHRLGALLATAAVLLLLAGGARALLVWGLAGSRGPEEVRGAGWVASGIRSHTLRDPGDRAVLVVRGRLEPSARDATPPRVELTPLGPEGQALGEPRAARLERLEDEWLAPEPLAELLEKATTTPSAPVTGFTVLLPDPPAGTRRYALALRPGPEPPAGSRRAGRGPLRRDASSDPDGSVQAPPSGGPDALPAAPDEP